MFLSLPAVPPIGAIVSAAVMRSNNGRFSKGFGFVNFEETAAAEAAVKALHGEGGCCGHVGAKRAIMGSLYYSGVVGVLEFIFMFR